MKTLLFIICCVFISSCSLMAPQPYGLAEYELTKDGTFHVKNGKEYASVEATLQTDASGLKTITYKATDASAFEGQRIGADISAQMMQLIPAIMTQAIQAAMSMQTGGVIAPPVLPEVPAPAPVPVPE